MRSVKIICFLSLLFLVACGEPDRKVIFKGKEYTVYQDGVVQGAYTAVAVSPSEIVSDYQSPVNLAYSPTIQFKFSINSRDNELPAGTDHVLTLVPVNGLYQSPVIPFGKQLVQRDEPGRSSLPPNTAFTVRVDMNDMIRSFKNDGTYTTPTGDVIYKDDFKGVYIAGSGEPLTWDFENLYGKPEMTLTDPDGDGIYEATILMNSYDSDALDSSTWKLKGDISRYPQYQSEQLLVDALYNMALDELISDIRPDGTLRAGAAWDGVWTRDISYSIYLSLAFINPDAARKSLEAKVKNGRIIQDTGTGGAWPVSSDRVVWSVAAWELYKVTGDKEWLKFAYEVTANSAADDWFTVRDVQTGLMRGEQSYLDWREQTYPRWMQPVDIYQSLCLGTNALHRQMYSILAQMAELIGDDPQLYRQRAEMIGSAMNQYLWMPDKGYYGQYLYGGIYPMLSPGVDNLGESLSILFDIASPQQAASMVAKVPVSEFGATSIYPQLANIKPYHNNAVWPFVQSYWTLASAKAGNETAVLRGLGALYRAAALFTTHKELFVASSGDFKGSAVNSDKMLWSLAGNMSMVYRLYYGMNFETDGIHFKPYVPASLPGKKVVSNFKYRAAVLNMEVTGTGNQIKSFTIDGERKDQPVFPAGMTGSHSVKIVLAGSVLPSAPVNVQPIRYMPQTTAFTYQAGKKTVDLTTYDKANLYILYMNGKKSAQFDGKMYRLPAALNVFSTIGVAAIDTAGFEGFSGRPVVFVVPGGEMIIEAETRVKRSALPYKGYSGSGFVELTRSVNTNIDYTVNVRTAGYYYVDVRYANGSGPINTMNCCAIRSLYAGDELCGPLVMPQRGEKEWANWGYSNPVLVKFEKGSNKISIRFVMPQDENMNGEINTAMLDQIRIRKVN